MFTWLVATALAAPQQVFIPVAVENSVTEEYSAYLAAKKRPEASLLCREIWEDFTQVCLQVEANGKRRFISSLDVKTWNTSEDEVWATLVQAVSSRTSSGLTRHRVTGDDDRYYWSWNDGTTWASGVLLVPHEILRVTKLSSVMVAMPTKETLLVWAVGDDALNQIMAIGAAEISAANDGLGASAFRLTRDGWQEGLVARPSD